jgi:HEAT repeat protein
MIRALEVASLALAAAAALFVMVLAARRVQLARAARRTERAEARLRPLALAILDGEEPHEELVRADAAVVAAVLSRYARRLAGEPRDHIARFFERSGHLAAERRALHARRAWRRAAAAFALGDMGHPGAVGPLVGALSDPSREVRSAAARSLGALNAAEGVEPLVRALATGSVPRAVAGGALLTIGADAVAPLLELADAEDDRVRASAIELLGLLGDAYDARQFAHRLRDGAAEVRAKTARALGRLGAAQASEDLRVALGDRIPDVRAAAAIALGEIGDRSAVVALWAQARGDRFEPARAAAHSLAAIDASLLHEAVPGALLGDHLAEAADLSAVGLIER